MRHRLILRSFPVSNRGYRKLGFQPDRVDVPARRIKELRPLCFSPLCFSTNSYDSLQRPEILTAPGPQVITHTYDAAGQRSVTVAPTGDRITFGYDDAQRINTVHTTKLGRTTYSYDAAGRRTLKKIGDGSRASYTYDNASQMTSLFNLKSGGSVISSFEYSS
jgi:YD repeat-containing protein